MKDSGDFYDMVEIVFAVADPFVHEKLIDKGTGAFQLNHARPLAYSHGKYYGLGEKIGGFGFSVKKKK